MLENLLKIVRQTGYLMIPAKEAPTELANNINAGRTADTIIIAKQGCAIALAEAESIAQLLEDAGGSYQFFEYKPGGSQYSVEVPYFITYVGR